jgi:hypothetical protein
MDVASKRESSPGRRMHSGRGGATGRKVPGSTGQSSRRHGKENQNLCQIAEVVEHRCQGKKEGGRKGKQEQAAFGRGRQGEARSAQVDSTVQEENVYRVLAKPKRGQGMWSSTIHKPSGWHDRGGLDRQGRQASKHMTGEGRDAVPQVVSAE